MYQLLHGGYLMILIVPKGIEINYLEGTNENLIIIVRVSINLVFRGSVSLLTGIAQICIASSAGVTDSRARLRPM